MARSTRDEVVSIEFPGVIAKATALISHPSRLANFYEPGPEYVTQSALTIPAATLTARVKSGSAIPPILARKARLRQAWKRLSSSKSRHGMPSRLTEYVYDARHIYNDNMAHLVQHHLAALCFVRQHLDLSAHEITILLSGNTSLMARNVFNMLGFPIDLTDERVDGQIVSVDSDDGNFFHLLPSLRHLRFDAWMPDTPARIFVSRRHSRKLKNEVEIQRILADRGFHHFYFEDLSIVEQWSIMRNAKEIVAIHGAALGTLGFKACDGELDFRLVELFGPGFVVNSFRKYCAVLSETSTWVGCRGKIESSVMRDLDTSGDRKTHAFDSFEVDSAAIGQALDLDAWRAAV